VRRREVITLLGGAAAWPVTAPAQPAERVRRVGVLMNAVESDAEARMYLAAFRETLRSLGWAEDRNVQLEIRWGGGDAARRRRYAAELVARAPDLILAAGIPETADVHAESRSMPVVFAQAIDPVGAGAVLSLARPGGSSTGFMQFEYSLSGKWPELLKEIAPQVKRAAVIRDPSTPAGIGQWAVLQAMAPSFSMELSPIGVADPTEMARGIAGFAAGERSGMIVPVSAPANRHRQMIIEQAAQHRLPAIYPYRSFVTAGGLLSYGPDVTRQYKQAAAYVARVLRGEKPADLPVQAPTKYELVINLKTAKALGLEVPPTLLARADEVIE
jgi:putative ABC transport system substrate-binding protein